MCVRECVFLLQDKISVMLHQLFETAELFFRQRANLWLIVICLIDTQIQFFDFRISGPCFVWRNNFKCLASDCAMQRMSENDLRKTTHMHTTHTHIAYTAKYKIKELNFSKRQEMIPYSILLFTISVFSMWKLQKKRNIVHRCLARKSIRITSAIIAYKQCVKSFCFQSYWGMVPSNSFTRRFSHQF